MRVARLVILLLLALAGSGCARHPPRPVAAAPGLPADLDAVTYGRPGLLTAPASLPAVTTAYAEEPYTLDSGDKLRVVVFGQEGLTNSYAVDAGGNITMPLIGAVPARGHTTSALSSAIAARLQQGYIREPHVAVEIEAYRPFFILGEVTYPGQYPYVANMTIETAVAIAGGFSPRAKRQSVDLTRTAAGQVVRSPVPVTTPVRPGDTITVGERWF
jgi:polysaccharide export outer membrane protein